MDVMKRGIRNAFRNGIRTFSIVIILGLSVGLALSMLVARQAVSDKITSVKSSIGNTITVSPAGSRGFQGGGDPLVTDQVNKLKGLDHVSSVAATLSDRLTTENTDLISAVEAGSLGRRQANNTGVEEQQRPGSPLGGNNSSASGASRSFTPPVIVTGASSVSMASVYGGDKVIFTSGAALDTSKDENVAVIGKALAEKNNLSLGSTFTAYDTKIKVVGIYDTGNNFSNAGLVMSLPSLQRLSGQTNEVTGLTVTVDSIDNIDGVTTAAKSALGSAADVTNDQAMARTAVAPLDNVKSISTFSLLGALAAGALVILLTMMMIVRERRREIGVMKAIGASNAKTILQFVYEAITLTFLGMIVGIVIGVAAASPITTLLVNNSTSTVNQQQMGGPGNGFGGGLRRISSGGATSVRRIQASVSWEILVYGVGAAFAIAIVGSALPAFFISKVRPAEVMRAE